MKQKMDSVVAELNKILLGKDNQIRLAQVACWPAAAADRRHSGMGKTTVRATRPGLITTHPVHQRPATGRCSGLFHARPEAGSLVFHPGLIFAQVVLADEINWPRPHPEAAGSHGRAPGIH